MKWAGGFTGHCYLPSASAHGFCMCVLYFSWILSLDIDSQSVRIDCLTILSWLRFLQALFMKTPNPPRMFITQLAVVMQQYISQNIRYWHLFKISWFFICLSLVLCYRTAQMGPSGQPYLLFDVFCNLAFLSFSKLMHPHTAHNAYPYTG